MLVFLNGQFVPEAGAVVPVNDRGFMLGDGLFETMRVVNGKPPLALVASNDRPKPEKPPDLYAHLRHAPRL